MVSRPFSYGETDTVGIKERKERERKQRSNDILEAARHLFETKGFLNTTLQDVAKEAEISVGLIYRYFQSKEDIFASLALKGAEKVDRNTKAILKKSQSSPTPPPIATVLGQIAEVFFEWYGPYGEYFDMLLYSYKGFKEVQIKGTSLTRLMSITLRTLERIKTYILSSSQLRAQNEDEALKVVFLLWAILLGCHKLFDNSGRGHLFAYAFRKEDFVKHALDQIMTGISVPSKSAQTTPSLPDSDSLPSSPVSH